MQLFKQQVLKLFSYKWPLLGFTLTVVSLMRMSFDSPKSIALYIVFCMLVYVSVTSISFCVSRILTNTLIYIKKNILDKNALVFDLTIVFSQMVLAYCIIPKINYFKAYSFFSIFLGILAFIFLSYFVRKTLDR